MTPRKILVISLAGIGDTLFATPLIRALRERFPDAVIDAFVLWKGAADVLRGNPHLNTVFQEDLFRAGKRASFRYALGLRQRGYDLSINTFPQSRIEYRVIARIIGAQVRLSHDYGNHPILDRWLVTHRAPQDYTRHCVENNLALLTAAGIEARATGGGCELFLTAEETTWAARFLEVRSLKGRKLLGIHVGSGGTKNLALRRWPLENYAALIKQMRAALPHVGILLFGGPEEREAHTFLLDSNLGADVHVVQAGSLREAAAVVGHCQGFLSVDTALMHVAALMRVPHQVVIETPTWNQTVTPYANPFVLVPNPAVGGRNLEFYRYDGKAIRGTDAELRRIMESVTVEAVLGTVAKGFAEKEAGAPSRASDKS
jgi:ADP-heptose:LPS heptosyltransferase